MVMMIDGGGSQVIQGDSKVPLMTDENDNLVEMGHDFMPRRPSSRRVQSGVESPKGKLNPLAPKIHYSPRGHPLLYVGDPPCDLIVLENYCKWYEVFLLKKDGTVEPIDVFVSIGITQEVGKAWMVDHCFHPYLLDALGRHYGAEVHDLSREVAAGRWENEINENYLGVEND